jgi:transposase
VAKGRLSMRKTKEILRLKFDQKMSNRKIAKSCGTSHSVVADYLCRAKKAGLDWLHIAKMNDAEIETKLFPNKAKKKKSGRRMPVMEKIHIELKKKGVTLQLLWHEYKYDNPEGYQYSQYCDLYRRWGRKLDVSLRQQHRAGEKLFIDYAGQTIPIINPTTGKSTEAQIFLATFGASCYTYVEASPSQALPFWIKSHIHAFEYFQGVSALLIPDNLKSGVNKACRYEPDLNPTYHELAKHYGTTVIPARVRKPKDKAKVENAVKIAENWILAALRNHTFFSLGELNQAISQKLEDFNNRKFQKLPTTRRELFLTVDKPALKPLPTNRYEYADWAKVRVNMDYHIEVDRHHYSVPYPLVRELLDVRITDTIVEVLHKNQRVASHVRSYEQGEQTTLIAHMPKSHQKYLEWTPSRLLSWAEKNGTNTNRLFNKIMKKKTHTEQAFRSCLGIMRLEKGYTAERLEAACTRAFFIQSFSYKSVASILKNGLDQQPHPFGEDRVKVSPVKHPNIRGNQYYK